MDSTKKHRIVIESQRNTPTRSVFCYEDRSLLDNLLEAEVEIDHSCGGNGTCGTCRIQVTEGLENFSEIDEIELEMKLDREFNSNERLCCQSHVTGPCKIKIP